MTQRDHRNDTPAETFERQRRRKVALLAVTLGVPCVVAVWLLLGGAPSPQTAGEGGINVSVPDGKVAGIEGDKRKAAEKVRTEQVQSQRLLTLGDDAFSLTPDDPHAGAPAAGDDPLQRAEQANRAMQAQVQRFYATPQPEAEVEALRERIEALQAQLDAASEDYYTALEEQEAAQQEVFNYCVSQVSEKKDMQDNTVKGSQFRQPMLEFSGSCAGCAETSYARLITQLFGDRMYISNATGCSSIWGGPAATSPYCTNKEGHGPAWANSLFEDNAEHGLGMYLGQQATRSRLADLTRELIAKDWAVPALKEAGQKWLDTMEDSAANGEATKAYIAALESSICTVDELLANPKAEIHAFGEELKAKGETLCQCDACKLAAEILADKEFLSKKSMWIFGGDGWAYDIGFGGLDHVLASGNDVNVFVFDTEVYSNTGGQASKASNIGQVAQFAAAGKEIKKKSLAEIAMSYGYIYVAQVAMGANPAQTLKAIQEAEAYPGPSLIIGYAPCEMHSIKGGMMNCQKEMKKAVECGYWNLFRFNPAAEGAKFTLDSKEPAGGYQEFLMNEARYSRLTREFPDRAGELFQRNEKAAMDRYQHLLKLKAMYSE